jgi:hypothetical protein
MLALPTKSVPYGLRPLPEAEPLLARLRGDAPVDSKEPSVAPSDVRVRVLNGKGSPGLAGDTSAALSGVGFTVSQPADADRLYARTEIRYLPRFQAKAELLARYLGGVGRFVADPALRNLDVVLVAGADFKGVTERPGPARSGPATPTTTTTVTTTATTAPTPTTKASRPANPTGVAPQPAC